jgi:hypothetical protein
LTKLVAAVGVLVVGFAPVARADLPADVPAVEEEIALLVETVRPHPRGSLTATARRCTADGTHCITRASYTADVCRIVETVAEENGLDPNFFARLLWRESLFDPSAVSPAGAQGIAQFMPSTAELRGLEDPFNPAEALVASAVYLAELTETFGNIGLAAVAYNGGEGRAARFLAGESGLPRETRDYVAAITGFHAETWRDTPPASLDLSLEPEAAFQDACLVKVAGRTVREFVAPPPPWGVIVATNRDRAGVERHVARLMNRHRAILGNEVFRYVHERRPGALAMFWVAQVGRETQVAADELCLRLRRAGGDCSVRRN